MFDSFYSFAGLYFILTVILGVLVCFTPELVALEDKIRAKHKARKSNKRRGR